MKRIHNKVALVLLLALVSMGAACPENKQQSTAQYTKDFFVAFDAIVSTEIDLHDAGNISDAQHSPIRDQLLTIAITARTAERALAAGAGASTALEQVRAGLESLAANDIAFMADPDAKSTLTILIGTAQNALAVWISHNP